MAMSLVKVVTVVTRPLIMFIVCANCCSMVIVTATGMGEEDEAMFVGGDENEDSSENSGEDLKGKAIVAREEGKTKSTDNYHTGGVCDSQGAVVEKVKAPGSITNRRALLAKSQEA
jgi:hypothetical protein